MTRIRTTRQARRLRPVAVERSRQSRLQVGSQVFYGGIVYGMVRLDHVYEGKPYRVALLSGTSSSFFGRLTHAYPDRAQYEAAGMLWGTAPKP